MVAATELTWDEIEARLLEWAREGNQAAFAELMAHYERMVYSLIYRMMGDADDAYDLTQNTFVKAYLALTRFRQGGQRHFSAWLMRIATNQCLDVLRRRQRLRWLPWEGPKHDQLLVSPPLDDPERVAVSQETGAMVQRVLGRMSHRHRMALILREYEGLSCEEIGEVMGLSRSAVKALLFRAREEFRQVWLRTEGKPDLAMGTRARPGVA